MPLHETPALTLALVAALGYLLGSIPFGVVITRLLGLGDLRSIGSGNIGATNVLRTGNKGAAAATLLLDAGKGAVAVLLARALIGHEDAAQVAGASAFIGHLYPVWLGFKGGKGVATFLGTLIALAWPIGLLACAVWLFMAGAARISSLAALVATAAAPVMAAAFGFQALVTVTLLLGVLVFWRHRANIARLLAGTEPKIGAK